MGLLIDLLKAATGERSLHGRIGRWRLALSRAVDALEPAYVLAARTGSVQTIANLAAATDVVMDTLVNSRGSAIGFNPATGVFTLQPGLYELDARLAFEGFDTVASDIAQFIWRDTLGASLSSGATGISVPPASTQNLAVQPSVQALIEVTSVTSVVPVSVGGQGGADVSVGSFVSVRKVG